MENLFKWNAANLHYLVVEPGLVRDHEVPPGWAARKGWALVSASGRNSRTSRNPPRLSPPSRCLRHQGTNCELGMDYPSIEAERRGLPPPQEATADPRQTFLRPSIRSDRNASRRTLCQRLRNRQITGGFIGFGQAHRGRDRRTARLSDSFTRITGHRNDCFKYFHAVRR